MYIRLPNLQNLLSHAVFYITYALIEVLGTDFEECEESIDNPIEQMIDNEIQLQKRDIIRV